MRGLWRVRGVVHQMGGAIYHHHWGRGSYMRRSPQMGLSDIELRSYEQGAEKATAPS